MGTTEQAAISTGVLTPNRVLTIRAVLTLALRVVGVGLIAYGVFLFAARVVWAVLLVPGNTLMQDIQVWGSGVGEDHGWVRGIPMVIVGVAIAVASKWIARWAVIVPDVGCPRCGYAGSAQGGICPECGLRGVAVAPAEAAPESV